MTLVGYCTWVLGLLASLVFVIGSSRAVSQEESYSLAAILGADHFQLIANVRIFGSESIQIDHELVTSELYSRRLARARLEIRSQTLGSYAHRNGFATKTRIPPSATYFYGAKLDKLVRIKADSSDCQLVPTSVLTDDLFGSLTDSKELSSWLELFASVAPEMPKHVIGIGQLLYLVELNRQRLKELSNRRPRTIFIRNFRTEQHEISLPLPESLAAGHQSARDKSMKLIVYTAQSGGRLGDVPLRIWLRMPSGVELLVDLASVEPLRQLHGHSLADEETSIAGRFSYPLGLGCSRVLSEQLQMEQKKRPKTRQELHLFELESEQVLSFEAELIGGLNSKRRPPYQRRLFVAYDSYSQTYRLDRANREANSYTVTIEDLSFGQRYHLKSATIGVQLSKSVVTTGRTKQPIRNVAQLRELSTGQQECYVTTTNANKEQEPLLALSRAIEMGESQVRGMEARVFELMSNELPRLLFPRVSYTDLKQAQRHLYEPQLDGFDEQRQVGDYSLVYYFALTSPMGTQAAGGQEAEGDFTPLGPLLRVDVLQETKLKYRFEVFNFRWSLARAPNGDKQDELFSLRDKCNQFERNLALQDNSLRSLTRRSASLLLLELVYLDAPHLYHLTAEQILAMLGSAPARHCAIIRSLSSERDSLYATQILNIKSRVQRHHLIRAPPNDGGNGSELKRAIRIVASLEVARSPRPQFEALVVASGRRLSNKLPTKAANFDECFWHAAQLFVAQMGEQTVVVLVDRVHEPVVLFSFCQLECLVDARATRVKTEDELRFETDAFYISKKLTDEQCEILEMRLAQPVSTNASNSKLKPWSEVFSRLHKKSLTLRINDLDQSSSSSAKANLFFQVDRLELGQLALGSASQAQTDSQLSGLGLVPNEVTNSEPIQLAHDSLQESRVALSLDACKAHCVANLTCKSYSTCMVGGQQAECVISQLDLHNSNLMTELKSKLHQFQRDNKQGARGKISLEHNRLLDTAQPDQWENSAATGELVEFKVDARCDTRAKRALELFGHQSTRSSSRLVAAAFQSVANLEQCAQLCLRKNVNFFNRLRRIATNLSIGGQVKPAEVHEQLMDSMRYWCTNFKFLDPELRSIPDETLTAIRRISRLADASGLCYLTRPSWAPLKLNPRDENKTEVVKLMAEDVKEANKKPKVIELKLDTFEFQYVNLYTRQANLRLLGDAEDQLEAIFMGSSGETKQQDNGPLNRQTVEPQSEVETCARSCFSQATQWCRSFDFIQVVDQQQHAVPLWTGQKKRTFCIFNSLSLADLEGRAADNWASSLENEQIQLSAWHYEPQAAYQIDNVILSFLQDENASGVQDSLLGREQSPPIGHVNWWPLLLCLLGVASGLALATLVTRHLDSFRVLREHWDRARNQRSAEGPGRQHELLVRADQLERYGNEGL